MRATVLALVSLAGLLGGCSADSESDQGRDRASPSASSRASVLASTPTTAPDSTPPASASSRPPAPTSATAPARFSAAAALASIRTLTAHGPREATSAAFGAAAAHVERRFASLGYRVRSQSFSVPAGISWGIRVRSGTSRNVIAEPAGFDPRRPHLVVGAHLDSVPQAPGAVDNAAGVAIVLEAARLAAAAAPPLPTVFVAFGGEEPRGAGDNRHHYGSRAFVASMSPAQRSALTGMISIDRVGVGTAVPVCTATDATRGLARMIRATGSRLGIRTRACVNRSSDHWSFERAGMTGVRIGSVPYAEYHSANDRYSVVDPAALARTGRLLWASISAR